MMIASVVVDVPASGTDHPFDYHVPEVFETWIEKGMRVIVPFGPRKIQGFISALQNGVESDRQLKAISKVIDVEPVLDEELLELGF